MWVSTSSATAVSRARPDCRREAAILNTDDNARIEFAAPNDLIGFRRYEYLPEPENRVHEFHCRP